MIQIKVINVVINRGDVMTKPSRQVWLWELPVLEEKFPGGLVERTGSAVVEREELPDPADEFSRLDAMYGVEADTKQSLVNIVYGRGEKGIKKLTKAIAASVVGAETEEKSGAETEEEVKGKPEEKPEGKAKADATDSAKKGDSKGPKDPLK